MTMRADWISFLVAFMASVVLIVPVRYFALRYGIVDRPNSRKVHLKPMPLLGGIAIYLGFVFAVLLAYRTALDRQIIAILAGATLLLVVGLLDERGLLHHQVKLFVGMPLAAVLLILSGIRARFFSEFIPGTAAVVLDVCFTAFWVVGITASFSILDHMDGLCAGIATVAAAFFAFSAGISGQPLVWTIASAAMGAALGFLVWNFNPAKIFMGDGGAMMLGYLMATLGLTLRPVDSRFPTTWLVPILILGVPIFDTSLISVSRSRRGLIPFTSPGKDHAAHRLSNLGLGHRSAVVLLYIFAILFGIVGLVLPRLSSQMAYVFAGLALLVGMAGIAFLEAAPYERQAKKISSAA